MRNGSSLVMFNHCIFIFISWGFVEMIRWTVAHCLLFSAERDMQPSYHVLLELSPWFNSGVSYGPGCPHKFIHWPVSHEIVRENSAHYSPIQLLCPPGLCNAVCPILTTPASNPPSLPFTLSSLPSEPGVPTTALPIPPPILPLILSPSPFLLKLSDNLDPVIDGDMVTNGLSIASIRGLGVASGVEGVAMNEPRPSIRGVPSGSCEMGSEGGGRGR